MSMIYAELDSSNVVIQVIITESRPKTGSYKKADQSVGIGYNYSPYLDIFIPPKPFKSWKFIDGTWQEPKERPLKMCYWDEEIISWRSVGE